MSSDIRRGRVDALRSQGTDYERVGVLDESHALGRYRTISTAMPTFIRRWHRSDLTPMRRGFDNMKALSERNDVQRRLAAFEKYVTLVMESGRNGSAESWRMRSAASAHLRRDVGTARRDAHHPYGAAPDHEGCSAPARHERCGVTRPRAVTSTHMDGHADQDVNSDVLSPCSATSRERELGQIDDGHLLGEAGAWNDLLRALVRKRHPPKSIRTRTRSAISTFTPNLEEARRSRRDQQQPPFGGTVTLAVHGYETYLAALHARQVVPVPSTCHAPRCDEMSVPHRDKEGATNDEADALALYQTSDIRCPQG